MLHTALLTGHIIAGTAGLILGPAIFVMPKGTRRHRMLGRTYQGLVATLACTAIGLTAFAPSRLWPFAIIAVATESAATVGWVVSRRQRSGWLPLHVGLMCGSYISFVTAFLVVNWPGPAGWLLPTVIGTPLIARAAVRAGRAEIAQPVG